MLVPFDFKNIIDRLKGSDFDSHQLNKYLTDLSLRYNYHEFIHLLQYMFKPKQLNDLMDFEKQEFDK